jgi:hypothetical protein
MVILLIQASFTFFTNQGKSGITTQTEKTSAVITSFFKASNLYLDKEYANINIDIAMLIYPTKLTALILSFG